jgi:hypothetical protein
MKTETWLLVTRLKSAKQNRYNTLSGITDPMQIAHKLDAFDIERLTDAVNIFSKANGTILSDSLFFHLFSCFFTFFHDFSCPLKSHNDLNTNIL